MVNLRDEKIETRYIYMILNVLNGKYYLGSTNNIKRRWGAHKKDLNKGEHHSRHLQSAWVKYGQEAFEFEILEEFEGTVKQQLEREQVYIDVLKPCDAAIGYNMSSEARLGGFASKNYKRKNENKHPRAKLTEEQVKEIKRRLVNGEKSIDISIAMGIKKSSIENIKHLKAWVDCAAEFNDTLDALYGNKFHYDYSEENCRKVYKLFSEGKKYKEIAILMGLNDKDETGVSRAIARMKDMGAKDETLEGKRCQCCGDLINKNKIKNDSNSRKYCKKCAKAIRERKIIREVNELGEVIFRKKTKKKKIDKQLKR